MFERIYSIIKRNEFSEQEQKMLAVASRNLISQTDKWHLNSPKKVAACVYIENRNKYVVAQNIGLSKVTGTQCAERSVIAVALSKFPDLQMHEITRMLIIGDCNPILPCGVCCEWLFRINPDMKLLTLKDGELLQICISDYYGDENTIANKFSKR